MLPRASLSHLISIVVLLAACSEDRSAVTFTKVDIRPSQASDQSSYRLRLTGSYGASSGPLLFGGVVAAAVSDDGTLAIADGPVCRLTLIGLSDRTIKSQIGRCGQGPGELSGMLGLFYSGDTLVTYLTGARSLVYIDSAGTELRRVSINDALDGLDVQTIGPAGSGKAAVGVMRISSRFSKDTTDFSDKLVLLVDTHSGTRVASAIGSPTITQSNSDRIFAGIEVCGFRDGSGVIAQNIWSFEGVVLDGATLIPRSRFITPLRWAMTPRKITAGTVGFSPGAIVSAVGCSDSLALFVSVRGKTQGENVVPDGGRFEVRNAHSLLLVGADFGSVDTTFLARPLAGFRDRFFVANNRSFDYPRVLEFVLEPRPTGSPALSFDSLPRSRD